MWTWRDASRSDLGCDQYDARDLGDNRRGDGMHWHDTMCMCDIQEWCRTHYIHSCWSIRHDKGGSWYSVSGSRTKPGFVGCSLHRQPPKYHPCPPGMRGGGGGCRPPGDTSKIYILPPSLSEAHIITSACYYTLQLHMHSIHTQHYMCGCAYMGNQTPMHSLT